MIRNCKVPIHWQILRPGSAAALTQLLALSTTSKQSGDVSVQPTRWEKSATVSGSPSTDQALRRFKDLCRLLPLKEKKGVDAGEFRGKWDDAARVLLPHVESISPSKLTSVLNCCREGAYYNESLVDKLLQQAGSRNLEKFNPQQVSVLIKCLAQMPCSNAGDRIEVAAGLLDMAEKRSLLSSPVLGAKELAALLQNTGIILSKSEESARGVKSRIEAPVRTMVKSFCEKVKIACTPLLLSRTLQGCANIGWVDPNALKQLCQTLQEHLANYGVLGGTTLAYLLKSLAKLNVDNKELVCLLGEHVKFSAPDLDPDQLSENLSGLKKLGFSRMDVLSTIAKTMSKPTIAARLSEEQLSNAVYNLGSLGFSNRELLLSFGDEIVKDYRLSMLEPHHLSQIILGYGRANCYNASLFALLLTRVVAGVDVFHHSELSRILFGLALIREGIVYDRMSSQMTNLIAEFSKWLRQEDLDGVDLEELCMIVWSMGKLGYVDSSLYSKLSESLVEKWSKGSIKKVQHVSWVLEGLSLTNDTADPELMEILSNWVGRKLNSINNPLIIAAIMRSKAFLGDLEGSEYDRMCQKLMQLQSKGVRVDSRVEKAVFDASTYVHLTESHTPSKEALDLLCGPSDVHPDNSPRSTRLMRDAVRSLKDMGIQHTVEKEVALFKGRKFLIDIYVESHAGMFAIFCNGPQHLSVNLIDGEYCQLGAAMFRNRIAESLSYQV